MRLAHKGLPVQGWGWADTVSQWSAFSKRHSLSISPKSSWEVQCQFYLEKARLQGLFSPLCCTVPCIKHSAPIPTERTILVFLLTNCPYLMIDYKRTWRQLGWCDLPLSSGLLNPSSRFSRVEGMNSSPLLWCKVWESILVSAPTNCCYIDGFSTKGICTLSQTAAGAAILHLLQPALQESMSQTPWINPQPTGLPQLFGNSHLQTSPQTHLFPLAWSQQHKFHLLQQPNRQRKYNMVTTEE